MTNQYLSDKDLQFKTASDAHRALQAQTLSAVRFGNFYQSLLSTGLWNSQASLSRSLGVSKAKISRALMAARLPDEVVEAFDGGEAITYRRAHAIGLLIGALGAGVVRKKRSYCRNCQRLPLSSLCWPLSQSRLSNESRPQFRWSPTPRLGPFASSHPILRKFLRMCVNWSFS